MKNIINKVMREVIEIEWDDVMKRLKHHRERLSITPEEMKKFIREKYGKGFWRLDDDEIIELGKTLGSCKEKFDIIF
jgi:hypothetical protein